jgi:hypothetical protein
MSNPCEATLQAADIPGVPRPVNLDLKEDVPPPRPSDTPVIQIPIQSRPILPPPRPSDTRVIQIPIQSRPILPPPRPSDTRVIQIPIQSRPILKRPRDEIECTRKMFVDDIASIKEMLCLIQDTWYAWESSL